MREGVDKVFQVLLIEHFRIKAALEAEKIRVAKNKTGWLYKRGDVHKSWKKRYFVLSEQSFQYFKKDKDALTRNMAGLIPLKDCEITEASGVQRKNDGNTFSIFNPTSGRYYYLWAETQEAKADWLKSLKQVTHIHTSHTHTHTHTRLTTLSPRNFYRQCWR